MYNYINYKEEITEITFAEPYHKNNGVPIVLVGTDAEILDIAVTLKSLLNVANSNFFYDVVIIYKELSYCHKNMLLHMVYGKTNFNLRFERIIAKTNNEHIAFQPIYSVEMYYAMYLPYIMMNYEKIIYISNGTLIGRDIAEDITKLGKEHAVIFAGSNTEMLVLNNYMLKNDYDLKHMAMVSNSGVKDIAELYEKLCGIKRKKDESISSIDDKRKKELLKNTPFFELFLKNKNDNKEVDKIVNKQGYFLFPYEKVFPGARIVLYGAGRVGMDFYNQLMFTNYCADVLWVDSNYEKYKEKGEVHPCSEILKKNYDFVVVAVNAKKVYEEIRSILLQMGVGESKIIFMENRKICY